MTLLETTPAGLAQFYYQYNLIYQKKTTQLFSDVSTPIAKDFDKAAFYDSIGKGYYDIVEQILCQNFVHIICNYRQVSLRLHKDSVSNSIKTMGFFLNHNHVPNEIVDYLLNHFLRILNSLTTEHSIDSLHYLAIYEYTRVAAEYKKISTQSEEVKTIILYLYSHNFQKASFSTLASSLEINERMISQHFLREIGESLQTFSHKRRVELAKFLLLMSDLTIPAIASMLNYSSDTYFKRVFKQFTQYAPKEFVKEFHIEKTKLLGL